MKHHSKVVAATAVALLACGKRSGSEPSDKPVPTKPVPPVAVGVVPPPVSDNGLPVLPPAPPLPEVPRGLPDRPATSIAPTPAGVALGELLFFDARVSQAGKTNCATCHDPALAFAGNDRALAADGRPNARRTPSLINLAWQSDFAWDGRYSDVATLLTAHIRGQLGDTADAVAARLAQIPVYRAHFVRAFGLAIDAAPAGSHVTAALAQYVSTRYSSTSTWDQVERTPNADKNLQAGYQLFTGLAGCATCHVPPLYTDNRFHRIGLIATPDEGRGKVDPALNGAFRTPSLRALNNRTAFFHDASAPSLDAAIDWHLAGGRGQNADPSIIDPALTKVTLTPEQRTQLGAFVHALEGKQGPAPAPTLP